MITSTETADLAGKTLVTSDGNKIGKLVDVYESTENGGQATFATVSTGMFGGANSFVPLHEATLRDGDVAVPYTKDKVKDAPRIDVDKDLSAEEEDALYRYYDLATTAPAAAPVSGTQGAGHDTSGPDTDNAMTRSEERLHVGTESVETGRARLRKRIVTEQVSTTVPVSHEELTVTREPITEANRGAALSGADLTEEEHEVTLHAERAVVAKETVPVERVQVGTETVTGTEQVDDSVRKEVVDLADETATNRS